MIVINVELHSAVSGKIENIWTGVIANDGTGTIQRGNYTVRFGDRGASVRDVMLDKKIWRKIRIEGWPRKRHHVWKLIHAALEQADVEERGGAS